MRLILKRLTKLIMKRITGTSICVSQRGAATAFILRTFAHCLLVLLYGSSLVSV